MNNPEPIYKIIGEKIRHRREALELSQQHLADAMGGLTRGSIANVEAGRQRILVHDVYTLAAVLHICPSKLLPMPTIETTTVFRWEHIEPLPAAPHPSPEKGQKNE